MPSMLKCMQMQGMPQGDKQETPRDPYFLRRQAAQEKVFSLSLPRAVSSVVWIVLLCFITSKRGEHVHTRDVTHLRFVQVSLKQQNDQRQRFLAFNRKVLRFYCLWDDRNSIYGERRPFVLHFYLEDDTVEVLHPNLFPNLSGFQLSVCTKLEYLDKPRGRRSSAREHLLERRQGVCASPPHACARAGMRGAPA